MQEWSIMDPSDRYVSYLNSWFNIHDFESVLVLEHISDQLPYFLLDCLVIQFQYIELLDYWVELIDRNFMSMLCQSGEDELPSLWENLIRYPVLIEVGRVGQSGLRMQRLHAFD